MRYPLLLSLVACAGREPVALLVGAGWQSAAGGLDPEPSHDPGLPCGAGGFVEELGGVEVDTEVCPYAVLSQPILADLEAGDTVSINWWHSDLVYGEEAEGHLLLTLNGEVFYEHFAAIPSDATAYLEEVTPRLEAAEGDLMVLHLHNHGFNTWNLFTVERR